MNNQNQKYRWYRKNESILFKNRTIQGMIYFGPVDEWPVPRPVIDPRQPVAKLNPDWSGEFMDCCPSYTYLPRKCRLAYLEWLSGERNTPIHIAYVFLYFYGLERRLFLDQAFNEIEEIIEEVMRLVSVYGKTRSFVLYVVQFFEAVFLLLGDTEKIPPFIGKTSKIPIYVWAGIGHSIHHHKMISSYWVWRWLIAHPEIVLPSWTAEHLSVVRSVFQLQFDQAFPKGLSVETSRKKIGSFFYRSASSDFSIEINNAFKNMPDVSELCAPLQDAVPILQNCLKNLRAYFKYIKKSKNTENILSAIYFLPPIAIKKEKKYIQFSESIAQSHITSFEKIMQHFNFFKLFKNWNKNTALRLTQFLNSLGWGVEPDVRFGVKTPELHDDLIVFACTDAVLSDRTQYNHCVCVVDACTAILGVDWNHEQALSWLNQDMMWSLAEQARFEAHMKWITLRPPTLSDCTSKIRAFSDEQKIHKARLILTIVKNNVHCLSTTHIHMLKKMYACFRLTPQQFFRDVHALETDLFNESIATRQKTHSGEATVYLNQKRIECIQSDTAQVSSWLSEIFQEEQTICSMESTETRSPGLNAPHQVILRALMTQSHWPHEQFQALCRSLGCFPDGATETINEWAFDTLGNMVLHLEKDFVYVDRAILEH